MCYIIYNKLNKKLNDKELIEAYTANPHGVGICYSLNGKIQEPLKFFKSNITEKEWFVDEVLPKIKELNSNPNIDNLAIHFRLASMGTITLDNVHPFKVKDNIYLMMNGTSFYDNLKTNDGKSDTANIAIWLSKQNINCLQDIKSNKTIWEQLNQYLNCSNALLLSDSKCIVISNNKPKCVESSNHTMYRSATNVFIAKKWANLDK